MVKIKYVKNGKVNDTGISNEQNGSSASIDDNTTSTDKTWSSKKIDAHLNNIANEVNDLKENQGSGTSIGLPTFLQGKKYIAEGDSIVEMQGTTTDEKTFAVTDLQGKDHSGEVRKGYIQEIEKRYGLVCTNTGAGGATIVSKYAELYSIDYSDVALVTIAFGVNDARTGIPLGTVNSVDTTTFAGCLNNLLRKIYTDNPECRVLILTPLQRLFVSDFGIATQNANGNYLIDFVDMCKKVANKRSTKCIDMYRESGLNQTTLYYYTQEGVHPLNEGYKRMSNLIISELDNMFKLEFNPFGTMTNVGDTEPDEPDTGGGGEEPPTEEPTGTVVDISELFINTGKNIDGWGTGEGDTLYKYAKYHPLTGKSYTIITYAPLKLLEDASYRLFSYTILNEDGTTKSGNYMPNKWGFAQDVNDREIINGTEYIKVKATFTVPSTIDEKLVVNIPCATDCIDNFIMSYI